MTDDKPHARIQELAWAAALALTLGACAGNDVQVTQTPAGLNCVDDSKLCISQRERVLDSYMADNSRAWVKHPSSAEAYASGVRLFALSKRRKDLSCEELQHGRREADGAASTLRGPSGRGLTPAQVSRGVMLASDVSRELSREIGRRCKKA